MLVAFACLRLTILLVRTKVLEPGLRWNHLMMHPTSPSARSHKRMIRLSTERSVRRRFLISLKFFSVKELTTNDTVSPMVPSALVCRILTPSGPDALYFSARSSVWHGHYIRAYAMMALGKCYILVCALETLALLGPS